MTNEWGPPLTGDEMKALKGRIDPETLVRGRQEVHPYRRWGFGPVIRFHLPANHPYYKVREHNAKHPDKLMVMHDGSAEAPEDLANRGYVLYVGGYVREIDSYRREKGCWPLIIAYTPKPKESEVAEQFPRDEVIEYVLVEYFNNTPEVAKSVVERNSYSKAAGALAELIQQYQPKRLKPAVDVAAEAAADSFAVRTSTEWETACDYFKAGAAWQKENGNV